MKKFKSYKEYIESTNEKFLALNKAEQRVMIAQDIIQGLAMKHLQALKGRSIIFVENLTILLKEPAQPFFLENECKVCQRGAALLALVCRTNKFDVNDRENSNPSDSKFTKKLKELFSVKQQDLMEIAFEGVSFLHSNTREQQERAENFYNRFNTSEKRMIAICENIIKNKGTFKP